MLSIGDRVRVHARAEMGYLKRVRKVFRKKYRVKGWVVGATRRQRGTYMGTHNIFNSLDGDGVPAYLHVTGTVFVYRVTLGLMRKPFDVLPCDLILLEN